MEQEKHIQECNNRSNMRRNCYDYNMHKSFLLLRIFMTITKLQCMPHRLKILLSENNKKNLFSTPWWIKFLLCYSEPFYSCYYIIICLEKIMEISSVYDEIKKNLKKFFSYPKVEGKSHNNRYSREKFILRFLRGEIKNVNNGTWESESW